MNAFRLELLLYYYPREHIDYARQAKIRELKAGETATIVGTITACNCFTTVKNNKLTIFDLTIKDSSGRMKLSRFFMGSRFSGRGWQEQQKKMHPTGAAVAASGLVKETQYGLTLDNPQIEILEFDGEVDSDTVGRILPIYPLTDGVGADLVRRAMKAGLPAAARLAETLPEGLRSQYDLVEIQRAIAQIHFPDDRESLDAARRRLVFDEFFYLQLGLLSRRYREQAKQTSVILQPEGSQLRARGLVIRVKNALNPHAFCNLDEQRRVFDIDDLARGRLGDVQRQAEDVGVGLADVDKAGGNKGVHDGSQLEFADSVRVQFARLVANHDEFQAVPDLEAGDQLDHSRARFRLREHEPTKLRTGERSLPVEHHPVQVIIQRELAFLISGEVQPMPVLHLGPLKVKLTGRPSAGMMIPAVREQHAADIQKQCRDRDGSFHLASVNGVRRV